MHLQSLYSLQPLFLKPLYYPGQIIFTRYLNSIGKTLSFRSFDLEKDTDLIHKWVNQPYALPFWQLNGNRERVYDLYYNILRNSNGHSYIGLLDGDPVCQFDVYRVLADELHQFVSVNENVCGFHLLMSPNDNPVPGLTVQVVESFLHYYFSFPQATQMYAEPDLTNRRSNRILQTVGFTYHHAIEMSYKTAKLYSITKEQFYATRPNL